MSAAISQETEVNESKVVSSINRFPALDGLRGLAALYVVLHHAYMLFLVPNTFYDRWLGFMKYGGISVSLFIMLSGFCLALPVFGNNGFLRGGARQFLVKRARRILPPYYAALFCSLILNFVTYGAVFAPYSVKDGLKSLVSHVLVIHNILGNWENGFYGDYRINGVLWSIPVECQIYLVFPLLLLLWPRLKAWGTLLFVGVLAIVVQLNVYGTPWNGLNCAYYFLFTAGMAAAWIVQNRPNWSAREIKIIGWTPVAAFLCLCVFLHFAGLKWAHGHFDQFQFLTVLIGFPLLLAVAVVPKWRQPLSHPHLVTLGGFSYSLYLLHMPLLKLLIVDFISLWVHPLGIVGAYTLTLVTAIPVILCISYRFSLIFEQPFVNARHRIGTPSAASSNSVAANT